MSKILSGKVKKVSPSEVSADRYNFLSLGEAEPDLGVPAASGYLLSSDASGNRSWIESVVSIAGVVGEVSAQDLLDAIKTVDGTGSGLDADLLDGQSLGDLDNRYVNVDGDTMTGYLVINGVAPDTVTSLVTTGYVGVGNSSPSYELDVTGEINASVSVRAPIFYDSGDDSFYLDPANNATSLNVAGDIITAGDVSITGGITTVDSVQLNTSASVTVSTGEIAWNSDDETLDLGLTNGTVLQLGQEVHYHVQNQSGSTIADGRLVVAAGSIGNSGKILIEEWDPATYPPITIMGLTTETMANGESGYVTHFGKVRGIQTNGANYGETWLDGDIIYAGPSGGLTKVAPQAPNTKTIVALVITAHASNGTLFVRPTLSSSLANDDLVQLSSLSDNDLLYYNASNGRFENTSSLNTLTVDGINIDGTTISPSGVTAITVTGLETPVNATDAVNKAYVDGLVEGVSVRPAVKAATTANLSGTYDNGTDGIGATLNLGPAATLDIDGVTSWFEFDGVLVKDQTNAPENGRYYISQVGNASTDWILTRCGYCDEPAEIAAMYIFVQSGTVNAATGWVAVMSDSNSSGTLQVGIDDITFIQFSGAGTYTAGAGLELNGTVFSHADTSAAANLTASSRTYVTGLTFDTFGHVTGYTTGTETVVNTDTKYAISTEPGDNVYSKKIRLEGTDASSDDIVIAVGAVDTVYGLTISEAGDTITLAHANTSSVSNLSSDNANGNVIQDIALTFDTYGHVTGATVGTVNLDTRYDNYGSWTAQDGDTTSYTVTSGDILQFAEGNDINVNFTADDVLTFSHVDIARTDTNDTLSPGYGGSFTVVDSVTTSDRGHVTAVNLKTVTLPTADDTNTTYSISAVDGDDYSKKIRLSGSDASTDDVTVAVGAVGTTYGLTIERSTDTITLAHADTSTQASVNNSNGNVIQDITLDEYGHLTAIGSVDLDLRYVNVTGDTMTGDLTINSAGIAGSPVLTLNNSSVSTFVHSLEALSPNITAGQHNILVFGKVGNTKNSGYIGYNWAGEASNSNYVTIGHWGSDDLFRVYGDGVVKVGTNTVFHDGYHPNADTWTTARTNTVTLTGDVTGTANASVDGSANWTVSITATVADDSHDHIISNVDGLQDALDLKAPLASPALTGTPTAPTAAAATNDTQIATTEFVQTAVANLIDTAPTTLDTLNELAAALGDDPNFATTVTNAIAAKVSKSGDTMTGALTIDGTNVDTAPILNLQSGNDGSAFNNGAQIRFGYNNTNDYAHFIHTRHSTIASNNAIDFYVSDGTAANSITSGSVHTMSLVSGSVGIGTTAPTEKLDIASGHIKLTSGYDIKSPDNFAIYDTGASIDRFAFSTSNIYTTRAGGHHVFSVGNVGIGTTTPDSYSSAANNLVVAGTGQRGITIASTDSNQTSLFFADSTSGAGEYAGYFAYFHSSDNLAIATASTERVRIDSSGNVGIGTSSPVSTLDVRSANGATIISGRINNVGVNSQPGAFEVRAPNASGSARVWSQIRTIVNNPNEGSEGSSIAFHTQGSGIFSERLRIDSSGNVGIGTNTPGTKLDVLGSVGDVAIFRQANVVLKVGTTNLGNGEVYYDAYPTSDPNQGSAHIWRQGGTETARIDLNGNLGIGTSSPLQKLHIYNGSLQIESSSASGNAWTYYKNGDRTWLVGVQGSSADSLSFYDLNADIQRMCITSAGNVGIGTSAPAGKLHATGDVIQQTSIESNQSFYLQIRKSRGSVDAPTAVVSNNDIVGGIQFIGYTGTQWLTGSGLRAEVDGTVTTSSAPMNLKFFTGGSMATGTERMRITAAGNVGIGTSSPAHKLDVNGTTKSSVFRVADTVQIDDSTATTTSTTQTAIASWSATTFGGAKVIVEAKTGVNRHITELLITHDGTTAVATEYGIVHTAGQLATYDVDISGGNVRLLATAASATSTAYKVMQTMLFA